MLVPLDKISEASLYAIPLIAIITGFGGSLHCVGMCGGLANACGGNLKKNLSYQFGRFIGYISLGFGTGFLGEGLSSQLKGPKIILMSALIMGFLFIYLGVKPWIKIKFPFKSPQFLSQLTKILWSKSLNQKSPLLRSLLVGLLTIFLPCGFLYSVVLATTAFQNPFIGALAMGSFWLGTLPSMFFSQELIKRITHPLNKRSPKLVSLCLISLGLITIIYRINLFYENQPTICH